MNIYDIAKKAGVSTATVSRVINKIGNVSESTRLKVEKVIKDEGFIPNGVARSLASNSTKSVGIMVPDIRRFFESHAAYSLEKGLAGENYTSILCDTGDEITGKIAYLNLLREKKVEAIIVVGSTYGEKEFEDYLIEASKSIPLLLLNFSFDKDYPKVISACSDEILGMKQALSYLKKKAYKNPIFVSSSSSLKTSSYIRKKAGFIESLQCYYPTNEFFEVKIDSKLKDLSEKCTTIIEKKEADSLICETDRLAVVLFKELTTRGVKIPERFAMIGYDNIETTDLMEKRISSIDQMTEELSDIAVANLIKLLEGKDYQKNISINPKLVIKETC